jgi:hypothetical protein
MKLAESLVGRSVGAATIVIDLTGGYRPLCFADVRAVG